jgi:hypothetical protein
MGYEKSDIMMHCRDCCVWITKATITSTGTTMLEGLALYIGNDRVLELM